MEGHEKSHLYRTTGVRTAGSFGSSTENAASHPPVGGGLDKRTEMLEALWVHRQHMGKLAHTLGDEPPLVLQQLRHIAASAARADGGVGRLTPRLHDHEKLTHSHKDARTAVTTSECDALERVQRKATDQLVPLCEHPNDVLDGEAYLSLLSAAATLCALTQPTQSFNSGGAVLSTSELSEALLREPPPKPTLLPYRAEHRFLAAALVNEGGNSTLAQDHVAEPPLACSGDILSAKPNLHAMYACHPHDFGMHAVPALHIAHSDVMCAGIRRSLCRR